jgi:hypothetical protein
MPHAGSVVGYDEVGCSRPTEAFDVAAPSVLDGAKFVGVLAGPVNAASTVMHDALLPAQRASGVRPPAAARHEPVHAVCRAGQRV